MTEEWRLLQEYVRDGSQAAFAGLVERYLGFVYGVCRRETGDPCLAEDVTQVVFLLLARKAPTLRPGTVLSGWLFQTARFASRDALKRESRRQRREEKAAEAMLQELTPDLTWHELEPVLNDALARLSEADRNIVLLRFFEDQSLKAVGEAFGISEDTARKRVARAIEKLRAHLKKHGFSVTGAVLMALLSSQPAEALPASAATSIIAALGTQSGPTGLPLPPHTVALKNSVDSALRVARLKLVAMAGAGALLFFSGIAIVPRLAATPEKTAGLEVRTPGKPEGTAPGPVNRTSPRRVFRSRLHTLVWKAKAATSSTHLRAVKSASVSVSEPITHTSVPPLHQAVKVSPPVPMSPDAVAAQSALRIADAGTTANSPTDAVSSQPAPSMAMIGVTSETTASRTLLRKEPVGDKDITQFKLRYKVLSLDGQPPPENHASAMQFAGEEAQIITRGGEWSPWLEASPAAIQRFVHSLPFTSYWQLVVGCTFIPYGIPPNPFAPQRPEPPFPRSRLMVETMVPGGETSQSEAEMIGPHLGLMLWKDEASGDKPPHIDTLAGHTRRVYRRYLGTAALPANDRPRKVIFADGYLHRNDGDLELHRAMVRLLTQMGMNCIQQPREIDKPDESALIGQLHKVLTDEGVQRIYTSHFIDADLAHGFQFRTPEQRKTEFSQYVGALIDPMLRDTGWKPSNIGMMYQTGKMHWMYPDTYDKINADTRSLAAFHDYLKAHKLQPVDFGKADWSEVKVGGWNTHNLKERRLFYWSSRYISWAAARDFSFLTRAYEERLYRGFPVIANLWPNSSYDPEVFGPKRTPAGETISFGSYDWMEFGREAASTTVSMGFGQGFSQEGWSCHAAVLRSGAALGQTSWGATVGPFPYWGSDRLAQNVATLVGQGASTLFFYNFGPNYRFPGEDYSEKPEVYQAIARAARLTARAEDLLPGQRSRAAVAIVHPISARLWSPRAGMDEIQSLYLALAHSAIPVDFVDEKQLEDGALDGYKVIYLAAAQLPVDSLQGLLKWVRQGGTLVTTKDAGTFDCYDEPSSLLKEVSGYDVDPQSVVAIDADAAMQVEGAELRTASRSEKIRVAEDAGVATLARFEDGSAGLIKRALGQGTIYHFTCEPGIGYRSPAVRRQRLNPNKYPVGWRKLITLPVREAGVTSPVRINRELVEVSVLHSKSGSGMVVTLTDWSKFATDPAENVELRITVSKPVRAVESATRGKVPFSTEGNVIVVNLPLADVDMLKVYFQD